MTDKIKIDDSRIWFRCPGCEELHLLTTSWAFNGDLEKPTFSPSILVTSGHYGRGTPPGNCYCDVHERIPDWGDRGGKCIHCHSYIRDGQIQFLSDCNHALAGQTVDLPDFVLPGGTND